MENQKSYAINWTDGVKITQDHFLESYYNAIHTIQDSTATSMNSYNYGVIGSSRGNTKSLEIETYIHTNERLVLRLQACNAITANGARIVFLPDMYGGELPTASVDSGNIDANSTEDFAVVLTINPFDLIPVGEPDPEVIPLHHPYALPKISLSIVPKDQLNDNFLNTYFLVVGHVQWKNGVFSLDEKFIPPVTKIMYNDELTTFYNRICQVMMELKSNSLLINDKNRTKYGANKLARNTFALCAKVLDFIGQNQFEFNEIGLEQSPIFMASKISTLANYLSNELALMEKAEKEEVLQYYYEWIDIKPSIFEATIGEVMQFKYNHQDIGTMIAKVDYFIAIMSQLWKKLGQLEYVGQRKENIVISEDRIETNSSAQRKRSWSIID
ncbi:MAG: hypothetical protein P8P74_05510 [Crocinitomicaceae bacterium]|nr:hypothetical protein [Crocinitomicaceae bacterium]